MEKSFVRILPLAPKFYLLIRNFIMIQQFRDIQSCLNVFLASINLRIDTKIITFERGKVGNIKVLVAMLDAILNFLVG